MASWTASGAASSVSTLTLTLSRAASYVGTRRSRRASWTKYVSSPTWTATVMMALGLVFLAMWFPFPWFEQVHHLILRPSFPSRSLHPLTSLPASRRFLISALSGLGVNRNPMSFFAS